MTEEHKELVYPDSFQLQHTSKLHLPAAGPAPAWTAQGVIAALEPLATEERATRLKATLAQRMTCVTVVFENNHKPHNGSAVIRSCDAFGVQQAHFVRQPEVVGETKMKLSKLISKGSHQWVDLIEHQQPEEAASALHASGHKILVTHPKGNLIPSDLSAIPKLALVLGNERDGVGAALTDAADDTVAIPMRGFVESLNVSVTAAILLQAATRGRPGDLSPAEFENIYARWLRISVPRADEVLSSFSPC